MRSNATDYDLIAPATLDAVLQAMADRACSPIAGGTEVMVALCAGRLQPKRFISLQQLTELRFIDQADAGTLRIGSGTTFTDLRRNPVIAAEFPLLAQTAGWTGSIANQNRGTLGGNIANASPAADNPPALLVYDAELELRSATGARTLPYRDFHLGYKQTALAPGELIVAIRMPRRFGAHVHLVRKVGTRKAQAISKVALAGVAHMDGDRIAKITLAAASLLDRPARLFQTEAALLGQSLQNTETIARASVALRAEVAPIDDIRSTARYRTQVAVNLLDDVLRSLMNQALI